METKNLVEEITHILGGYEMTDDERLYLAEKIIAVMKAWLSNTLDISGH